MSGRIDHRGGGKSADPDLRSAARCRPIATPDKFYPAMAERGLSFGPAFRTLADLAGHAEGGRAESIARIAQTVGPSRHLLHPAVLDACFQALLGAKYQQWEEYLPTREGRTRVNQLRARRAQLESGGDASG